MLISLNFHVHTLKIRDKMKTIRHLCFILIYILLGKKTKNKNTCAIELHPEFEAFSQNIIFYLKE